MTAHSERARQIAGDERSASNCPLYPACYIAGDCGFEDWREGDCGLPKEEQVKRRDAWIDDMRLRNARWRLGNDLKAQAQAGKLDHLLQESPQ